MNIVKPMSRRLKMLIYYQIQVFAEPSFF